MRGIRRDPRIFRSCNFARTIRSNGSARRHVCLCRIVFRRRPNRIRRRGYDFVFSRFVGDDGARYGAFLLSCGRLRFCRGSTRLRRLLRSRRPSRSFLYGRSRPLIRICRSACGNGFRRRCGFGRLRRLTRRNRFISCCHRLNSRFVFIIVCQDKNSFCVYNVVAFIKYIKSDILYNTTYRKICKANQRYF